MLDDKCASLYWCTPLDGSIQCKWKWHYHNYCLKNVSGFLADPSGRAVARIVDSIPARGMDVCLLRLYVVLSCVGRGLCDEIITRPEESYLVFNSMWLRHLKGSQGPIWAVEPLDGWMDGWSGFLSETGKRRMRLMYKGTGEMNLEFGAGGAHFEHCDFKMQNTINLSLFICEL
jgi:hypothetical protein